MARACRVFREPDPWRWSIGPRHLRDSVHRFAQTSNHRTPVAKCAQAGTPLRSAPRPKLPLPARFSEGRNRGMFERGIAMDNFIELHAGLKRQRAAALQDA